MLFLHLLITISTAIFVSANVEKTIFVAPTALALPATESAFDYLGLQRLSPRDGTLRTKLDASFPTEESLRVTDSWYLLESLAPGQRYEVRICWLATQPTSFDLTTYTLSEALVDTSLRSAITQYASPEKATAHTKRTHDGHDASSGTKADLAPESVLFLRISAAADYFSLNQTLMENVPPVLADIILDPFLANVFPRSLVPTAGYIVVVACVAIVIARWIAVQFARVVDSVDGKDTSEGKKNQ
ncbi:hypothetical protein BJY04DRAFT_7496 [Aspergillus karnatakaensis]|uniref:uncharacterized protein n=1 Tax=Aspergillus karnatakaensis TaxID=1810916 RepID=UPI003CCD2BC2